MKWLGRINQIVDEGKRQLGFIYDRMYLGGSPFLSYYKAFIRHEIIFPPYLFIYVNWQITGYKFEVFNVNDGLIHIYIVKWLPR